MQTSTLQLSPDLLFLEHSGGYLVYQSAWNTGLLVDDTLFHALRSRDVETILAAAEEASLEDLLSEGILYADPATYAARAMTKDIPEEEDAVTPEIAYLQVTRACNLRCSYCYNRENLCQSDRTSLDTLRTILMKLRAAGVETLILTGGEPTVRTDFDELVRMGKELGFSLQLLTNGTGLSKHAPSLMSFASIIVSCDTLSSEHNARYGLNLSSLTANLAALPEDIRRKTTLRAVVGSKYPSDWRDVQAFADAHGFGCMATVMMPSSKEELSCLPRLEDLETASETFVQPIGCSSCGAGKGILALDGDGWIYPCQAMIRVPLRMANILEPNWQHALAATRKRLRLWERNVHNIEPCRRCSVKYLCGGGCMAVSYDVHGDLFAHVDEVCVFRRAEAIGKLQGVLETIGTTI